MAHQEPRQWPGIEIAVTPGEEIQNWLARFGICKPVQPRDMMHPEPPAGLWNTINGGAVFATIVALIAMAWLFIFHLIPALATLRLV
jgi:hypothetical protein